jgi:exopolysaccharide biosynthesis WecB/TagA/CpsF family protein
MDAVTPRVVQLLGIEFNNVSLEHASRRILARPRGARFTYIVTPNADHIHRLWRIPGLRVVYQNAMLCLLDSQFIGNCGRLLGLAPPEVVTGADLTRSLLDRLDHVRVAVIGMEPQSFNALAARYPKIIFLHHQPPMGLLHDIPAFMRARAFAEDAQAAFTFIALGSPVQELLAYAISTRRNAVGVGLCVGAALEFCAGTQVRAPVWMRRRGLEWLHRLARNPARLAGRYLISSPRVLVALLLAAVRQKAH